MSRIRVGQSSGIARITLARPEKRNALDRQTVDELTAAVHELEADDNVRVIALTGDGKDFCAGADLAALQAMLDASLQEHEDDAQALGNALLALHECKRPTVAVIRGRALAGGAGLATACDIVLAHEDSRFGYPEVAIGFVPAMVMSILVRSVGEKVAFEMLATARVFGAAEALERGLISRVLPDATFDADVESLLTTIAQTPPLALSSTKTLLHQVRDLDLRSAIREGVKVNARARLTPEFRAGVTRFTDGARQK